MAKNKQKGKKQQNVFQVANKQSKPKSKTKPVKTSLKHVSVLIWVHKILYVIKVEHDVSDQITSSQWIESER